MSISPAFGQADLTNCERELIHLAGSIQPHGLLFTLTEPELRIVQASANAGGFLERALEAMLLRPLAELGGSAAAQVRALLTTLEGDEPAPLQCTLAQADGRERRFEGALHRSAPHTLVLELEPMDPPLAAPRIDLPAPVLLGRLGDAVQRFSEASSIGTLADTAVRIVRELTGHDRVMVYKFDPDGHGQIIAEARDGRLEPLLGHRYPATDIPQRARELYLRNKVRLLVDVAYAPSPLVPRALAAEPGGELDMSMCLLRSMSPLHLQYLQNMGVVATLVVSLVHDGRLWGLIACHHYTPRNISQALRAACDLLGEAIGTRISAIEKYAQAQVAIQVRRLEQRLVEATSTEGDWRMALLRNPRALLQPLDATGLALFHDGEVLGAGETPSTPELRALREWVDQQRFDGLFVTSQLGLDNPQFASLVPTGSGVIAVRLSAHKPEYLMWFRKEQLHSVTWAGDPYKPMVGDDPLELSPRRSFAAWSEIVRGTAQPWTPGELAMAAALGESLVDIIAQVNAVRLLIAEHQLAQVRATVADSPEAVVVTDASGCPLHANEAFLRLARRPDKAPWSELLSWLDGSGGLAARIDQVRGERRAWRGEASLRSPDGTPVPVSMRVEPVPGRDGQLIGFIALFNDLTDDHLAQAARAQLEASLSRVARGLPMEDGSVVGAIIANASLAAMDIADSGSAPGVAPLLRAVEQSTTRATRLFGRIRNLAAGRS